MPRPEHFPPLAASRLERWSRFGEWETMWFPQFLGLDWARVSVFTWVSLVLSALLALNVAYLVWYTGVQKIGAARTSMYSNLVPIVAMSFAAFWLGEPLTRDKFLGAGAVLTGVLLTRLGRKPPVVPIEE